MVYSFILGDSFPHLLSASAKGFPDIPAKYHPILTPLLFSHHDMSDSFQPHGLQQDRLPCPSPSLGACWNSCPLSWWCHPTISASVVPFSSCLLSFPASGSFPMSQFFTSPKYWSFSSSISSSNEYSGLISFRIDWFDLLAVQGTLKSSSISKYWKVSIVRHSAIFMVRLSHPFVTTGRTIALTIQTFVSKVMSLLFNILSSFVIALS